MAVWGCRYRVPCRTRVGHRPSRALRSLAAAARNGYDGDNLNSGRSRFAAGLALAVSHTSFDTNVQPGDLRDSTAGGRQARHDPKIQKITKGNKADGRPSNSVEAAKVPGRRWKRTGG